MATAGNAILYMIGRHNHNQDKEFHFQHTAHVFKDRHKGNPIHFLLNKHNPALCMHRPSDTNSSPNPPVQLERFRSTLLAHPQVSRAIHRREATDNAWTLATIVSIYDNDDIQHITEKALDFIPQKHHAIKKPVFEAAANAILAMAKKVPSTTQFPIGTFAASTNIALQVPRQVQYDPVPIKATADKLQNRRWSKWTPRDIKETDEYNVRDLEKMLKTRWADALLGLLIPHIDHYPTLHQHIEIGGPAQAHAIFGTTRWGTLRQHTQALNRAVKAVPDFIPWTATTIISYFNRLKESKVAPSAATSIWLATYFVESHAGRGGLDPAHQRHVILTKDSTVEDLSEHLVDKPDRQATTLNMYEILDLEFLAITATHYADRVGAALFRFTLGCCARFDDTKHINLKSFADNEHTLEFTNTQTKTTGPTKKRHTIPLIAPKIDFHEIHRNMPITEATQAFHLHGPPTFSAESSQWWSTLLNYQHNTPPDSKRDYLFAIPSHDKTGFQRRPLGNSKANIWLKQIITMGYERRGLTPPTERIKQLNINGLRPTIPDLMYTSQIPAETRQNLGRWETMSSTLTYTRSHRNAVTGAWNDLRAKLLTGTVPPTTDPNHITINGPMLRAPNNNGAPDPIPPRTPTKRKRQTKTEIDATPAPANRHARHARQDEDLILTPKLLLNPSSKKLHWTNRVDKTDDEQPKTLGCMWEFNRNQVLLVHSEEEIPRGSITCRHCFNKYIFPQDWNLDHDFLANSDTESDYLGESSSDSEQSSEMSTDTEQELTKEAQKTD